MINICPIASMPVFSYFPCARWAQLKRYIFFFCSGVAALMSLLSAIAFGYMMPAGLRKPVTREPCQKPTYCARQGGVVASNEELGRRTKKVPAVARRT